MALHKIGIILSPYSPNSLSDIGYREFCGNLGNKNLECQATEKIKLLSTCHRNSVRASMSYCAWQTFKTPCL